MHRFLDHSTRNNYVLEDSNDSIIFDISSSSSYIEKSSSEYSTDDDIKYNDNSMCSCRCCCCFNCSCFPNFSNRVSD